MAWIYDPITQQRKWTPDPQVTPQMPQFGGAYSTFKPTPTAGSFQFNPFTRQDEWTPDPDPSGYSEFEEFSGPSGTPFPLRTTLRSEDKRKKDLELIKQIMSVGPRKDPKEFYDQFEKLYGDITGEFFHQGDEQAKFSQAREAFRREYYGIEDKTGLESIPSEIRSMTGMEGQYRGSAPVVPNQYLPVVESRADEAYMPDLSMYTRGADPGRRSDIERQAAQGGAYSTSPVVDERYGETVSDIERQAAQGGMYETTTRQDIEGPATTQVTKAEEDYMMIGDAVLNNFDLGKKYGTVLHSDQYRPQYNDEGHIMNPYQSFEDKYGPMPPTKGASKKSAEQWRKAKEYYDSKSANIQTATEDFFGDNFMSTSRNYFLTENPEFRRMSRKQQDIEYRRWERRQLEKRQKYIDTQEFDAKTGTTKTGDANKGMTHDTANKSVVEKPEVIEEIKNKQDEVIKEVVKPPADQYAKNIQLMGEGWRDLWGQWSEDQKVNSGYRNITGFVDPDTGITSTGGGDLGVGEGGMYDKEQQDIIDAAIAEGAGAPPPDRAFAPPSRPIGDGITVGGPMAPTVEGLLADSYGLDQGSITAMLESGEMPPMPQGLVDALKQPFIQVTEMQQISGEPTPDNPSGLMEVPSTRMIENPAIRTLFETYGRQLESQVGIFRDAAQRNWQGEQGVLQRQSDIDRALVSATGGLAGTGADTDFDPAALAAQEQIMARIGATGGLEGLTSQQLQDFQREQALIGATGGLRGGTEGLDAQQLAQQGLARQQIAATGGLSGFTPFAGAGRVDDAARIQQQLFGIPSGQPAITSTRSLTPFEMAQMQLQPLRMQQEFQQGQEALQRTEAQRQFNEQLAVQQRQQELAELAQGAQSGQARAQLEQQRQMQMAQMVLDPTSLATLSTLYGQGSIPSSTQIFGSPWGQAQGGPFGQAQAGGDIGLPPTQTSFSTRLGDTPFQGGAALTQPQFENLTQFGRGSYEATRARQGMTPEEQQRQRLSVTPGTMATPKGTYGGKFEELESMNVSPGL